MAPERSRESPSWHVSLLQAGENVIKARARNAAMGLGGMYLEKRCARSGGGRGRRGGPFRAGTIDARELGHRARRIIVDDWNAEIVKKLEVVEKERTLGIGLRQPSKSGLAHIKLPERHSKTWKLWSSRHEHIFEYSTSRP